MQQVCARAREQGLRVAQGHCQQTTAGDPFGVWTQILGDLADPESASRLEALGLPGGSQLEARSARPPLAQAGEEARLELFDEISGLVLRLSKRQPLVLVFENVQWADKSSVLLLGFVAREAAHQPVLILSTHRPGTVHDADPGLDTIRSWSHEETREEIYLEGMNPAEARTLLGRVAGREIPESVETSLVAAAGGNPLFLREAARNLAEPEQRNREPGAPRPPRGVAPAAAPEDVHALVLERVGRLEDRTQEVLKAAATLGERFELSTLSLMLGRDVATPLPHDVLIAALDVACAAHLTEPVQGKLTHHQFTHTVIRESIYRSMPPGEVRGRHRSAVFALEFASEGGSGLYLDQLAHHSYECALAGEAERSGRYNHEAAQRAEKLLAFEDAALFYERAVESHRLHSPDDRRTYAGLLLQAASAHWWAGSGARTREIYEEALAIGRDLQDGTILGWATLGTLEPWNVPGPSKGRTIEVIEEVLPRIPSGELLLRMHLLGRLAGELRFSGEAARGKALARELVAEARREDDPELLAYCCSLARLGIWGPENLEERLAIATEGLELCRSGNSRSLEFSSRLWKAVDLLEAGRCPEAQAEIDRLHSIARNTRTPSLLWQSRVLLATRTLLSGDLEAAEQVANDALAAGMHAHLVDAPLLHGVFRFQLCWLRGTLGELEPAITVLMNLQSGQGAWRAGLAMLYLETGRREQAREQLDLFVAGGLESIEDTPAYVGAVTLAGEVAVGLEVPEIARMLYDRLVSYAGRLIVLGNAAACHGAVDSILGALAGVVGREEEADGHFAAGVELESRLDAVPLTAKTRLAWGQWLAKQDTSRARSLLSRAAEDAGASGLDRIRDAARAALASLPATPEPAETTIERPPAPGPRGMEATIRQAGEYWTIRADGVEFQIKHRKGLAYLVHLLRHPRREFPAVELLELTDPVPWSPGGSGGRRPVDDAVSGIDATAIESYRDRLRALRAELGEAEENNDVGRQGALRQEIEFFAGELGRVLGPGGRKRRAGSDSERARVNVTRAIKRAIEQVRQEHPALGRSLRATIRTGNLCSFEPDPDRPLTWDA